MTILSKPLRLERNLGKHTDWMWTAAFRCDNCQELNIASIPQSDVPSVSNHDQAQALMNREEVDLDWEPIRLGSKQYDHTPPHIADAASEAYRCHSVTADRGASILARAVIEATAKDKGITSGGIKAKIEALEKQGYIRAFTSRQAQAVREFANEMAHGDYVTHISHAEAAYVLALMDEVLNEVYEAPGRLDAFEQARNAAQAAAKAKTTP
jgi:hypothetical protein